MLTIGAMETLSVSTRLLPTVFKKVTRSQPFEDVEAKIDNPYPSPAEET